MHLKIQLITFGILKIEKLYNIYIAQMKTVSIIIATFNAEKTLNKALDSVLNQTYQNWECIIVDGASKDNTINIVKGYAQKDSRFRYISEPDKGIFDAYNKGWKLAKGKWIYYLGADDVLLPESLKEVMNGAIKCADILYGNINIVFPNESVKTIYPYRISVLRYKMFISHQATIMRRCVVEELGGFDLRYPIAADFDLLQRCFMVNKFFVYRPVTMANFSYSGVSSKFSLRNELDLYRISRHNKANPCPLFFFCLLFIRHLLGYIQKKYFLKSI